jgi:DNA-binding response OmpR family regulator
VLVAQLRRKIEANPAKPRFVLSERSIGYRLGAQLRPPRDA